MVHIFDVSFKLPQLLTQLSQTISIGFRQQLERELGKSLVCMYVRQGLNVHEAGSLSRSLLRS